MSEAEQPSIDALLAHRAWVTALARTLCADPNRADDVVQETWLAALRRPPRHGTALRAWLARVVRRRVLDDRRGASRRDRREAAVPPRESPDAPDDAVAQIEAHGRVVRAVVALAEPYRTTIVLRFFRGLAPTEIATRTSTPVDTVKSRLKRGLAMLREELAPGDERGRALSVLLAPLVGGGAWRAGRRTAILGGAIMAAKTWAWTVAAIVVVGAVVAGAVIESRSSSSTMPRPGATEAAAESRQRGRVATKDEVAAAPMTDSAGRDVAAEARGLVGEVRRSDGKPAARARVNLFALAQAREWSETPKAPQGTDADAAGRFAFRDVAPGDYALEASAPGSGIAYLPIVRVVEGAPTSVVLRLDGERAVAGRVVAAEDGSPIVDAVVRADAAEPLSGLFRQAQGQSLQIRAPRETRTDAQGRFRLAPLFPGLCTLEVQAPGRLAATVTTAAPADGLDVPLKLGGRVRATVTVLGEPLPAELHFVIWGVGEETRPVVGRETTVVFESVTPGDVEIHVRARGHGMAKFTLRVVAGRETAAPPLVLEQGTEIRGAVREAGTERPLPGAKILLASIERTTTGSSGQNEETIVADAAGAWTTHLRAGEWQASTSLASWAETAESRETSGAFQVGREPQEVVLHLVQAPAIVGRVEYTDGAPVVGANVMVASAGENEAAEQHGGVACSSDQQSETDKDGRFRIQDVVTSGRYTLQVDGRDGESAQVKDVVFQKGRLEAEAVLRVERVGVPGAVEGRVVDENARPVAGALVVVGGATSVTDDDGRFRAAPVAAGKRGARVAAVGFAMRLSDAFDVPAGVTVRLDDLVLRRHGLSVHGRVTSPGGAPVGGASVTAWFWATPNDPQVLSARTGPDGTYRIEGPDVAPHEVEVQVSGVKLPFSSQRVTPSPDAAVDFAIGTFGEVVVPVTFAGPAVESLAVELDRGYMGSWQKANTKWDREHGTATATCVSPGPAKLRVRADGYAPGGFQTLDVPDGGSATAKSVRLTSGGAVAGRVVDAVGRPIAEVQVSLGEWFVYVDTDVSGRFRLEHVPPGTWKFEINAVPGHEDRPSPEFAATVKEGETTEVEWRVGR